MADILPFPSEDAADEMAFAESAHDRFLLDEGLELLGYFRSIEDRDVRDSLRTMVKAVALASRKTTTFA